MSDKVADLMDNVVSLLVEAIQKGRTLDDDGDVVDPLHGVDPAIRFLISAAAEETLRRVRMALHTISNFEHRSEREKELLLDLIEALGGNAAG